MLMLLFVLLILFAVFFASLRVVGAFTAVRATVPTPVFLVLVLVTAFVLSVMLVVFSVR